MAIVKKVTRNTQQVQQVYFADFKTQFDLINNRDLELANNEAAILQALHNLVSTDVGERLYNPAFGCDIRKLLFEPISPQTESALRDAIQTAIENYEPRAKVLEVFVEGAPDENSYYISITFSVINRQQPITLEFVLARIR